MLRIETTDARTSVGSIADKDGLGIVGKRVHQSGRMCRDDKLGSFAGESQGVGYVIDEVRMQAKFGLIDANKRRRCRIVENRE